MPSTAEAMRVLCDKFVAFKRAEGVAYIRQEMILHKFLNSSERYWTEKPELTKEAVIAWNNRKGAEKHGTRMTRVNTVRAFAAYLNARGVPAHICAPLREKNSDFVPYIFSNDELARLFKAADNRPNVARVPKQWFAMPMLIRTIYACGLRLSEAVSLRVCDVDLETGVMTILGTKFHKDRLIPLHKEFLIRLRSYSDKALSAKDGHSPFFPTSTGKFYSVHSVYGAYRKFLWDAGISHGGKGRGPRLHDLRHTFAVNCLKKWVLAGDDLTSRIPYLSAYLGHVHFRHTQVYLRLTAEMYPSVVTAMEKMFDVLPDWGTEYEAD